MTEQNKEFGFDMKLDGAFTVHALNEADARVKINSIFDCAKAMVMGDRDPAHLVGEVSLNNKRSLRLFAVDGVHLDEVRTPTQNGAAVLPPDVEGMNDDRAAWADAAIKRFQTVTGTDREDAVADLICDLRHWCDLNGFDFQRELGRGNDHYADETLEPPKIMPPCLAALWDASPAAGTHSGVIRAISATEVIQHVGQGRHVVWDAKKLSGDSLTIDREANISFDGTVRAQKEPVQQGRD